jgi:protein-S-isoprenylcysteine O-methyltransferase Ste14
MTTAWLWALAALDCAFFIAFAYAFAPPRTSHDWRSLGGYSAFVVSLFTERYGFPLTIFLLAGPLRRALPGTEVLEFAPGHPLQVLLAWREYPSLGVFHVATTALVLAGLSVVAFAWRELYAAEREGRLATHGPYAFVRHPQYVGFALVMMGFLLQWPTLLTLAMYPLLLYRYTRVARREEAELSVRFGAAFDRYAASVPPFLPKLRGSGRSMGRESL